MTYNPNFNDPRVQKRIKHALGFVKGVLNTTKPKSWSTRYLDTHLGSQRNELSKYLRGVLLITTNNHWNKDTGKCKEYRLNESGVRYLRGRIDNTITDTWEEYCESADEIEKKTTTLSIPYCSGSPSITQTWDYRLVNDWCRREFQQELEELSFEYIEKSDRLWHPLQNVRSQYRSPILAESGLVHQYDIAAAAPTLIHQHAQKLGMDLWLDTLRNYLKNKTQIRDQLCQDLGLDIKTVKVIINALFCGARIGNNPDFAISQLLDNNPEVIELLKQHEFIQGIRSDIRVCWQYIESSLPLVTKTNSQGQERKQAMTSNRKWRVYFQLERQVMSAVERYLRESHNRYFLEHDGWSCESPVDIDSLCESVREQTGFVIQLDKKTTTLFYTLL